MQRILLLLALFALQSIAVAEVKPPADKRLLQPVTIESTGKRLHSVVDEISKATGVTIRCGKDSKDWQVRDIPVAVCTHDLPLGVLLQALADCTHTHLSRETGPEEIAYRFWRDQKRQSEIDNYAQQVRAQKAAEASWGWDVAADLQNAPKSALRFRADWPAEQERYLCLSPLLSSLGTSVRDRVLAGEKLTFDPNTAEEPLRSQLLAYMKAAQQSFYEMNGLWPNFAPDSPFYPKPGNEQDAQQSRLVFGFREDHFEINVGGKIGLSGDLWGTNIVGNVRGYKLPERPELPDPSGIERSGLIPRDKIKWRQEPKLMAKLALKKTEGKAILSSSDVLLAIAKERGLSLVCEDFHRYTGGVDRSYWVDSVQHVETLLSSTNNEFMSYWDSGHNLLVACDRRWPQRQGNLVPEDYFNGIIARLKGDGVSLQDMVNVASLTEAQCREWLCDSLPISEIQPTRAIQPSFSLSPLRWYASLAPQEQEQMISRSGLPVPALQVQSLLDSIDQDVIRDEFHRVLGDRADWSVRLESETRDRRISYYLVFRHPGTAPDQPDQAWKYLLTSDLPIYSKVRAEELRKQQKASTPLPSSPGQ